MTDRYGDRSGSLEAPASHGFTATASDVTDLVEVTRALYVGSGGTLALVLQSGAEITLENVGSGTLLPLRARRVKQTGTSAGALVGLV